nr:hypothetical protein [Tanacetum cinerariifolium]
MKNTKPRHEFVYKPPSIRNDNDNGDVNFIEEDEIKPIPAILNPNPIMYNSLTISPSLKDCIAHNPYTNAKTFTNDVLPNHVGGKEFKSINGVRIRRMKKKEKNDYGVPKELYKEWKLNEKVVPQNKNDYHYL